MVQEANEQKSYQEYTNNQSELYSFDSEEKMELQNHNLGEVKVNSLDSNILSNNQKHPSILPTPVINISDDDDNTSIKNNNNPITAADEDLIEKEWIERAKKIVSENRDDPHSQDKAVNDLQADYIYKRYGRKIGSSEETKD